MTETVPSSADRVSSDAAATPGTVYWLTGLAGVGKTSLAERLVARLRRDGGRPVLLDGDELRRELFRDVGYSRAERLQLARHYAALAELLSRQGFDVVCATISLFPEIWERNRRLSRYVEVLLRAPEAVLAERRPLLYGDPGAHGPSVGREIEAAEPPDPDLVLWNDGSGDLDALAEAVWQCGRRRSSQTMAPAPEPPPVAFGTKAETLERLEHRVVGARVLPQERFEVREWRRDRGAVLSRLARRGWLRMPLILRSSALGEDRVEASLAGHFPSRAGCLGADPVQAAIEEIAAAMPDPEGRDQIFAQPDLGSVRASGVVFTRDPAGGAHYRIVSEDRGGGPTGAITSGHARRHRTHFVHRSAPAPKDAELAALVELADELTALLGHHSLDFEYARGDDGVLYLLQVRRLWVQEASTPALGYDEECAALEDARRRVLELSRPHPRLLGSRALFGRMPDWNPAEILGARPRPLALSLYRELVTDSIWAYQRHNYGYRNLRSFPLVVSFAGLPYVDVRVSFESFVPAALPEEWARQLVDLYLNRLLASPEAHDKVEFRVVVSCLALDQDERLGALQKDGFPADACVLLTDALRALTNRVACGPESLLAKDLAKVWILEQRQADYGPRFAALAPLDQVYWLLEDTKRYGTLPFAGIARAAFMARQMLDSLVTTGLWSAADRQSFLASLDTVSARMQRDLAELDREQFLGRYGHLRPGTYDLLSPRYDEAPDHYFDWSVVRPKVAHAAPFAPSPQQNGAVDRRLAELGLELNSADLLVFLRTALEGREHAKFVFTRNLSDALRILTRWGASLGHGREDMAHCDIATLRGAYAASPDVAALLADSIARGRAAHRRTRVLSLPSLLCDPEQVLAFELASTEPNFVTLGAAEGPVAQVEDERSRLAGAILLIPNADPGFDWIFSAGIAGFATMYGGHNSHMAIRANELGVPAVIGAGETNYAQWCRAAVLSIDCQNRTVEVRR